MTQEVKWLIVLGVFGAAGTWLRAVVALLEHRAAQRRRRLEEGPLEAQLGARD